MLQNHPSLVAPTSDTGFYPYTVDYSCRFDGASRLSRTMSGTAVKTITHSMWVKRSESSAASAQFVVRATDAVTYDDALNFNNLIDDAIKTYAYTGSYVGEDTSVELFRDYSAWMHVVWCIDTTETLEADRNKVWVNGQLLTQTQAQAWVLNADTSFGRAIAHYIGGYSGSDFKGYLAEVVACYGQAYTPTDFAEDKNGIWVPKNVSGLTFGTEGFYLDFADSADLGNDVSGNANDFTSSGLTANDRVSDTPSNNYCTLNPLAFTSVSYKMDFANGNLQATGSGATPTEYAFGTILVPTDGSHYFFEATMTTVTTECYAGIADPNTWGATDKDSYLYRNNGNKYEDGASGVAYGNTYTTGDVIGVRIDGDNLYFYKNGTIQNSGTAAYTDVSSKFPDGFVICVGGRASDVINVNCGQQDYAYSVPTGAVDICAANLPEPTIGANSATKPSDCFAAVLYTGNGTAIGSGGNAITGVGFQPDMVWIKNRDAADQWMVFDSVRGATKYLSLDGTDTEVTDTESLSSFDTDGFTLGSNLAVNTNTENYVAYCFKITAGFFDIQQYTGNATARTISHDLGVVPTFYTCKGISGAARNWWTYCGSLPVTDPETDYLYLDLDALAQDSVTIFNDTAPTSSVYSVGNSAGLNATSETFITYLFADVEGFCEIGYYKGNGNADGPFEYLGLSPQLHILKRTDAANSWYLIDTAINPTNDGTKEYLGLDYTAPQAQLAFADMLSNGVKMRSSLTSLNASGGDYITLSIGGNSIKYSNAR